MSDNYPSSLQQDAIHLENVSKRYKLFPSYLHHLAYLFRLDRLGFDIQSSVSDHYALRDVSLSIPKGQKLGIIGRNGSGKTTLLKLICQAIAPTSGKVAVSGHVQALLNIGLGFHMEDTGLKNIISSLSCSGLYGHKLQDTIDDIVEFCELGEYIYQPLKTYSLGMQSRLMFATSTAVSPDILIIDEMLGAGDAYFLAKSKQRISNLINSGCTVLVVSHAMSQILELCDTAIWIDKGHVRMNSDAFSVVKAYEEYLFGPIQTLEQYPSQTNSSTAPYSSSQNAPHYSNADTANIDVTSHSQLTLLPLPSANPLPNRQLPSNFTHIAPGGISHWQPDTEDILKVVAFTIASNAKNPSVIPTLSDLRFSISIELLKDITLSLRYGLVIQDQSGNVVSTFFSPEDKFTSYISQLRLIDLDLSPCLLGPGQYIVGISIHPFRPITSINETPRFALLSRSFTFALETQDSYSAIASPFIHPCKWSYGSPVSKV